jgi:hypothetical protein
MTMIRRCLVSIITLGLCLSVPSLAQTADSRYPVASRAGVIESLSFSDSTLIISGYRYSVAVDAKVEIGGSYGAFTMLRPGMRVHYDYLVISPSARRIIQIQELPSNVVINET